MSAVFIKESLSGLDLEVSPFLSSPSFHCLPTTCGTHVQLRPFSACSSLTPRL